MSINEFKGLENVYVFFLFPSEGIVLLFCDRNTSDLLSPHVNRVTLFVSNAVLVILL